MASRLPEIGRRHFETHRPLRLRHAAGLAHQAGGALPRRMGPRPSPPATRLHHITSVVDGMTVMRRAPIKTRWAGGRRSPMPGVESSGRYSY
eukprot:9476978-Pyramimonas_sp.AAC.1